MSEEIKETGCCPKFDPTPWDSKEFEWNNKKFIKDSVFTLFYMPMNFGKVITKLIGKTNKAGAVMTDNLCLSDHTSKWNMDIYVAVDKEIPDARNVTLSGKYLTKVYEGSFTNTDKWCKDFISYVKMAGKEIKKMYMWYTTCPKCAKAYGKNYVVIIAEEK